MNTISDWNVVITLPVWQSNGFAEGAFCADAPTTLTIQEQREPEWNDEVLGDQKTAQRVILGLGRADRGQAAHRRALPGEAAVLDGQGDARGTNFAALFVRGCDCIHAS